VIELQWWEAVLFFMSVGAAIWGFLSLAGFWTRTLSRRTERTAESMYPNYADSARKQRRYAREHGGQSVRG
jgi:hypothetical protein